MILLLEIAQLPRATFYYHQKRMQQADKYAGAKEEIAAVSRKTREDMAIAVLPQYFAPGDTL